MSDKRIKIRLSSDNKEKILKIMNQQNISFNKAINQLLERGNYDGGKYKKN